MDPSVNNQPPAQTPPDGSLDIPHQGDPATPPPPPAQNLSGPAPPLNPMQTTPAQPPAVAAEDDEDIPPGSNFFDQMEVPTTPPEKVEAWRQALAAHPVSPYFQGYYGQRYAGVEFSAEDLAALEDMLEQIKSGEASQTPEVPNLPDTQLPPLPPPQV